MTCRVIRKNESKKKISNIELRHKDTLITFIADDVGNMGTGLSTLYEIENATSVLGKTAENTVTNAALSSIDITVSNNQITLPGRPTWSLERTDAGFRLKSGAKYLAHKITIDNNNNAIPNVELINGTAGATVWQIGRCADGTSNNAFKITVSGSGTKYCLAYNHSAKQFCTCEQGKRYGNTFELYLYKEIGHSADRYPVYTYEQITDIDDLADNGGFIIVAQGTPDFSANIKKFDDNLALNAGLLNNLIIPALLDAKTSQDIITPPDNQDYLALYSTESNGEHILLRSAEGAILLAKKTADNDSSTYLSLHSADYNTFVRGSNVDE
jgi:hypothetical protein